MSVRRGIEDNGQPVSQSAVLDPRELGRPRTCTRRADERVDLGTSTQQCCPLVQATNISSPSARELFFPQLERRNPSVVTWAGQDQLLPLTEGLGVATYE
jgi:hypothetical protein